MEQEKCGLAVWASCKAKLLLAGVLDNQGRVMFMLLAAGAVAYFSGIDVFESAFAELPPTVAQASDSASATTINSQLHQAPIGNSYYRSISESMSLVASHGSSGANSPSTYYRSITESLSVTTAQGKANSYSRSMAEQASFTSGMPSSSSVGQQFRASPTPHSASSIQRIDERFNLRNLSGGKADTVYRDTTAGTPVYSTDSVMSSTELSGSEAGVMILDTASVDGDEGKTGDHSSGFHRQIDAVNDYILMRESIQNAALVETSVSAVFLIGTFAVAVGNRPTLLSSGRMQKGMYALFLLRRVAPDGNATSRKIGNTQVTYVLLLLLVIFTVSSVVKAVDPLAGQAFAAISFVNAGASSFTNGGSPTPSLPAGLQDGDLMIAYFYSKEDTDGTVSISSGWTPLYNDRTSGGLLGVWYRVYQSGDSAPTFTLGGHSTGGAGDTAGAHIAAWRGINTSGPIDVTGTIATNVSQQDIGPISGITLGASDVVIVVGGKRTDWSSVNTLSGDGLTWAEIGEPDSTLGSDAGLVWDYAIDAGSGTTVTAKTFTVTGGADAQGKGVMFSLNARQNFQINPSETLGLTESISAKITGRAIAESLSITESIAAKVSARAMTDNLALSDTISSTRYRPALDQFGINESISAAIAKSLTEQFAMTDTTARSVVQSRSMSEQMGIADAITVSTVKPLSESFGMTDAIARSVVQSVSMTEQFAMTDTTARSVVQSRSMSEQMAVIDSIAKATSKALSEQLGFTDTVVRSIVSARTVSEQMAATDSITKAVSRQLSENLGITESTGRAITVSKAMTEQLGVTESIVKVVSKVLSEQMGVTDGVAGAVIISRTVSEQLGVTEIVAKSISKTLAEQMSATDQLARSIVSARAMTEQFTATETVTITVSKALSEQIVVTEGLQRSIIAARTLSEQMGVIETTTKAVSITITEQLAATESVARSTIQSISTTEQMALTDTTAKAVSKPLSEQLGIADTIMRTTVLTRTLSEQMTVAESVSKSFVTMLSEQMALTEQLARNIVLSRLVSEQLGLTDSVAKAVAITLTEQMAAQDTLARAITLTRTAAESLALQDSIAKAVSITMTEQFAMTDTTARSVVQSRSMSEQMGIADAITVSTVKPLSESFGMTDAIARSVVQSVSMTEQMAVSEIITKSVAKSIDEQLNMAEALDRTVAQFISASEQLAMSDTIATSIEKLLTESLGMTDVIVRSLIQSASMTEQLTVEDAVSLSITKELSEQFAITDSLATSATLTRGMTEQFAIDDIISITVAIALSDQLTLTETIARSSEQSISVSEELSLTEMTTKAVSLVLSDQLAVSEVSNRTAEQAISLSEQLVLAETIVAQVTARGLIDALAVSDFVNMMVSRSMAEQLNMAETAGAAVSAVTMTESITISDAISVTVSTSTSDQLGVAESISISINKSITDQLAMSESIVTTTADEAFASDQLGVTEFISIIVSKQITDDLVLSETIMTAGSAAMTETMAVSDALARSVIINRAISDSLAVSDTTSGSPVVFIIITDSMGIDESFADIALFTYLNLSEPLVLAQGFATNFTGFFNQVGGEGIALGDNVTLTIESGETIDSDVSESMEMQDSLVILLRLPPPSPPITIEDMPGLMITESEDLEMFEGLTDPLEAVEIEGEWEIEDLDEEGLESMLDTIGMPVYDVSLEANSDDIQDLTLIMPTFWVSMEGDWSNDAGFLTPTLSDLPSGMQVIVPINLQASMEEDENLDMLGNMTVNFTTTEMASNFTMLITMLDNNPEADVAAGQPSDRPAFFIDMTILGDFPGTTPNTEAFFEEPPSITFTLTEDWAAVEGADRDSNNVPIIGMYLLDEGDGSWLELTENIEPPTSIVDDVYTYTATLPHFSTYVFTTSATEEDGHNGGGRRTAEYARSLVESMLVSSTANMDLSVESEGKVVIKDITDSLTIRAIQPQTLHQRVITIHNVTVAVNVADVKPAAELGTAVATLIFEIINKNGAAEEILLTYWYFDPASGEMMYEDEQTVTVSAGQSLVQAVEIPFYSEGVFDLMIEAESDDGTIATTDIAVAVPWLAVYLYALVAIALAVMLISLAYVIFVMRRARSHNIDKK